MGKGLKRNEAGNNHESVQTCQIIHTPVISEEQLTIGEMKGQIPDSEWDSETGQWLAGKQTHSNACPVRGEPRWHFQRNRSQERQREHRSGAAQVEFEILHKFWGRKR